MKYLYFLIIGCLSINQAIYYNFSPTQINRKIKQIAQPNINSFPLNKFFSKNFINNNWTELEKGISFRLPDEYRDKKTIFEVRACFKNDKRYVVINIEGENTDELIKKVENFIEGIKDYPPYDDVKLILQHGEINPKEPLIDAFSILNLNNLEFSIVIDDMEFHKIKDGEKIKGTGDGYTQIDRVAKNVLSNLFKCICNEIKYYLDEEESNKLVSAIFESKKAFTEELIHLRDYYQDLIEGRSDMVAISIQEEIKRTVKEIKYIITRFNNGISYFQNPVKGNLYYRIFYRHYIKPNAIIPKGNQPVRLNIPNGN